MPSRRISIRGTRSRRRPRNKMLMEMRVSTMKRLRVSLTMMKKTMKMAKTSKR